MREIFKKIDLVVIKVGSKVLLKESGQLNYPLITHLVEQIASLKKAFCKIVFVSSGAVGAGMEALGLKNRPLDLPTLQAAASIGQVRLMRAYEDFFRTHGLMVGQVLLTHDDLKNRKRHLTIKHTLLSLLNQGVIPIINENDTVSTNEIKFGDNDVLASLVAMLLEAKALILLTTAEGFLITNKDHEKITVSHLTEINDDVLKHIETHKVGLSSGGMKSKLLAATNMMHVGGIAVIASGLSKNVLIKIFAGENVGTVVGQMNEQGHKMPGRKRWIAFYHKSQGVVEVDDGAKLTLFKQGKSLLPIGICSVNGHFSAGSVIDIRDSSGRFFAKGITQLSKTEIEMAMNQLKKEKSNKEHTVAVIHRNNMVIIKGD